MTYTQNSIDHDDAKCDVNPGARNDWYARQKQLKRQRTRETDRWTERLEERIFELKYQK